MSQNRQDDRAFRYVRDIFSTDRRGTGVPVVFGLTRVNHAIEYFTKYLRYLLTDAVEPRTGELKRAVREIFEGSNNSTIGDGTVPKLEGHTLSPSQVAELAYLVLSLSEKPTPAHSSHNWRSDILTWTSIFVKYNAHRNTLWQGFINTPYASNGNPVLIYRMFLLSSGITLNTTFDPSRLGDATLPRPNDCDYARFKNAVNSNPDYLNADIRSKIWSGFKKEQNRHYLAAEFPKPSRMPRSSETMLEMFDCYFNCREFTYDRDAYLIEAGKAIKTAKAITTRYWPMIGSIAICPIICSSFLLGCGLLATLLVLWHNQRHAMNAYLCKIPYWGPKSTTACAILCACVGNTPWLAFVTAIPVSIFAAHLGRNWETLKSAA